MPRLMIVYPGRSSCSVFQRKNCESPASRIAPAPAYSPDPRPRTPGRSSRSDCRRAASGRSSASPTEPRRPDRTPHGTRRVLPEQWSWCALAYGTTRHRAKRPAGRRARLQPHRGPPGLKSRPPRALSVIPCVHFRAGTASRRAGRATAARGTCTRGPSSRSGCRRSPARRRTCGRAASVRAGRGTRRPCSPGSRTSGCVLRTLKEMCVRPTRFHGTVAGGCCGWNSKISRTPPPGTRIQPILQRGAWRVDAEEAADAFRRRVRHAHERTTEHVPVELHGPVEVRYRDADVAERSARTLIAMPRPPQLRSPRAVLRLMWSATRSACATIVSPGLTAADDGKNDASTTKRFVDVVRPAERIEHRRRAGPCRTRACRTGASCSASRCECAIDDPEPEPLQDPRHLGARAARWAPRLFGGS